MPELSTPTPTPPKAGIFRAACKHCAANLHATSEQELSAKCAHHIDHTHPGESAILNGLRQVFTGLVLRRYFRYQSSDRVKFTVRALRQQISEIVLGLRVDLDEGELEETVKEELRKKKGEPISPAPPVTEQVH